MWPDGKLKPPPKERTAKERENSRLEAKARLIINIPNDFKRIVGGHNCRQGALRVFEMLQHPLLNKRLLYAVLEVWWWPRSFSLYFLCVQQSVCFTACWRYVEGGLARFV